MRVSTRARYGVNAVYELAKNYDKGTVAIKTISDEQEIPVQYVEQLIVKLRKAGIVESQRGAKGGYKLSRDPKDITAWEVIICLEGDFAPVHCKQYEDEGCPKESHCAGKIVWQKVNNCIKDAVGNITFQDLLDKLEAC
jgi:Rrf2 family protein